MHIRVRLFATLAKLVPDTTPGKALDVELPAGTTVADLISHLSLPMEEIRMVFVNGRARPADWVLNAEDEVGIFPPVGGG